MNAAASGCNRWIWMLQIDIRNTQFETESFEKSGINQIFKNVLRFSQESSKESPSEDFDRSLLFIDFCADSVSCWHTTHVEVL